VIQRSRSTELCGTQACAAGFIQPLEEFEPNEVSPVVVYLCGPKLAAITVIGGHLILVIRVPA